MGINKRNYEGYYDPTPYEALKNIERKSKNQRHGGLNQKNNQNRAHKKHINQSNQSNNQKTPSKVVYVCSPLRGDMERNMAKACEYCRFVVATGYIPLATHLMFPRFMNDDNADEREVALFMGVRLLTKCDEVWCFGQSISEGMASELAVARELGLRIRAFNDKCEEVTGI